ncbi:uncharacterized protein LOC143151818 [Ptiloglossa arizonensis]|uniref:uncharacterized protein LOC143151818 n=1 Tax=Ptiloglossa arizonensis TaxID=3350558 RepID=UPI003F9EF0D8
MLRVFRTRDDYFAARTIDVAKRRISDQKVSSLDVCSAIEQGENASKEIPFSHSEKNISVQECGNIGDLAEYSRLLDNQGIRVPFQVRVSQPSKWTWMFPSLLRGDRPPTIQRHNRDSGSRKVTPRATMAYNVEKDLRSDSYRFVPSSSWQLRFHPIRPEISSRYLRHGLNFYEPR